MTKLYELSGGDVFWWGKILWQIVEFAGDHRICRPTTCPETGATVTFHIDTEVEAYDF